MTERMLAVSIGALMVIFAVFSATVPVPAVADHCKGKHKNDPGCEGGTGGGGGEPDPIYQVSIIADIALGETICDAPLFHPGDLVPPILATTVDQKGPGVSYSASYPRHLSDGGPTLVTDTGAQLADDLRIIVGTNDFGQIVSVQIRGQPEIGKEALAHESEVVQLAQSVNPIPNQSFYVHVEKDHIPLWQLSRHTGGKRVGIVGEFCLGDFLYTPQP